MNKLLAFFKNKAAYKNALIAFVALRIVVAILYKFDQPLNLLTPGEGKLDFHSNYDVSTVMRIYAAYDEEGRTLYAWDLMVDTFYPVLLSLSAILFVLLVARHPLLQKALILPPLIFAIADVIENVFFLFFIWMYPSLSPTAVSIANIFTRIKLFTFDITFVELYLFILLTLVVFVINKLKGRSSVAQSDYH